MTPYDRPLDNPINWSFRAGQMWGITIRVHVAFLLCVVVMLWMEARFAGPEYAWSGRMFLDVLGTYALLFLVVLLHELGHCYGARRMGGEADEILLWPLGGLAFVNPPHNPRAHMFTTLAGPTVNLLICALCSAVLIAWRGSLGAVPWNPLHPMVPVDPVIALTATEAQTWVLRLYGLSYFLLLINLLPIFPFDGGRIVQAWLWPRMGYRPSMMVATGTGMIGAIVVGLFALFLEQDWLLLMIAVFGYLTCWQVRRAAREDEAMGSDFSRDLFGEGHRFLEEHDERPRRPGYFERRRLRKSAQKEERERQRKEAHDRAVEEVLRKVSQSGLASLNPHERRILEEETRRKRSVNS